MQKILLLISSGKFNDIFETTLSAPPLDKVGIVIDIFFI